MAIITSNIPKGIKHDKEGDSGGQDQIHERGIAIFC
jgi:hypothetical protein